MIRRLTNRYFSDTLELLSGTYELLRPFGRRKVAVVLCVVLLHALAQMVSVVSIFPFLAVAANPEQFASSGIGRALLEYLPGLYRENMLLYVGSLAILILFASNGMSVFSEYVRNRFAFSFAHWLRTRLVRHFASQPYTYHLSRNSAVLTKKTVGDVNQFANGVLLPLLDIVARLLMTVLLVGLLFAVDAAVAGIVLGVGVGYYVLVFWRLRRRLASISAGLKTAGRQAYFSLSQLLGGIKPILVQGRQQFFVNQFEAPSARQAQLETMAPIYSNTPRYFLEAVAFGGIVLVVLLMSQSGTSLGAVLPTMGLFAFAGYRLLPTLQLLYAQVSRITSQRHTLEEVQEELQEVRLDNATVGKCEETSAPFSWNDRIRLEHVTFSYPGSVEPVLSDIDIVIPKRSTTAFVGPTGSGKSTLVDLILGLHRPTSGTVFVDGRRLSGNTLARWRKQIGYVPQDIYLLDDSLSRNIAFGVPENEIDFDRVRRVADYAQIGRFIEEELPDGFQTRVGERGVRLSGGQRQRIALARALYSQPEVLMLDEATSALDNRTEADFMRVIEGLSDSLTIIMIAHRLTTVQGADRIFYLENGRIAGGGTFESLIDHNPQFRSLVAAATS